MDNRSKDLLHLEHKNRSTSPLESAFLVRKKDSVIQAQKPLPDGKPITAPLPKSQVLGKVRDFLGVISEANERLKLSKDNSEDHDIEVLTGKESEVIEMNLMLGVADLHTPEAVAAAESAIAGSRPVVPLTASSSETDSEDSSNTDCDDDDNEDNDSDDGKGTRSPMKLKTSKLVRDNNLKEDVSQLKKQTKIVELS